MTNKPEHNITSNNKRLIFRSDLYAPAIFFIITAAYFKWFGDYVLFFQEQEALFVYTGNYLKEYLVRPGGIAEYIGFFLTQFYYYPAAGAVIIAAVLALAAFLVRAAGKRTGAADPLLLSLTFMIPSCLLLLMQAHYYHLMVYNLGYLSALAAFLCSYSTGGKFRITVAPFLLVILYFTFGAFALIYTAMCLAALLRFEKGSSRYVYPAVILLTAGLTLLLSRHVIFTETTGTLLTYPLPLVDDNRHRVLFFILTAFLTAFPLIVKMPAPLNIKGKPAIYLEKYLATAFTLAAMVMLLAWYNPQRAKVIRLQKLVAEKEWEEAVRLHETSPSRNLIGQFYYNLALAETNQLSTRLFHGKQDFGPTSLILPWGDVHLNRGALFYYATGLINEAHRWAYESMVIYGYRPQNMLLLAKANLINGNYRIAEIYISILRNTLNYRSKAVELGQLLNNDEAVMAHPELGEKVRLLPKEKDFFIDTEFPQRNILMLLEANPANIKAFEYKLAWLLLTKEVEEIVSLIPVMGAVGYTRLPRHVEEAVLVYSNATGMMPDLGGLDLSSDAQLRFSRYINAFNSYRQNPGANREVIERFDNTFWYYLHFN